MPNRKRVDDDTPNMNAGASNFSENLRTLIFEKGFTQSSFARQSGVKRDSISRYINGHAMPTYTSLKRLMEALDCTQEDLLGSGSVELAHAEPSPELAVRAVPGLRGKSMLHVNRIVSTGLAAQIFSLIITEDDKLSGDE